MRRLVQSVAAWLLVAGTPSLAAQRVTRPLAPRIEEPRPAPIFPAAFVPFSIPDSWCDAGGTPQVTLRVFGVLSRPLHTLRLRGRGNRALDRLPLRCGTHVAVWNGTVGDPPRLAVPYTYYLRLEVAREGRRTLTHTVQMVVLPY